MPRHAKGRRPKPDPKATVYVIRVALSEQDEIWRRIAIRSDQTLDELHAAIFEAFDRFDEHLYSFYFLPPDAPPKTNWRDGVEYTSPVEIEEADPFGEREVHNAAKTGIGSLGLTAGRQFHYLFDFGDGWQHDLLVESTGWPLNRCYRYPMIVEKHKASPPQYPPVDE